MYLLYHCLGVVVIILLSRPVVGQENGDTVNNHVPHAIHNPHHHRAGHRPPHQPNPSQQDVHYRHTYNVSSPHFKAIANQTYARVLPCLTSAWMLQGQHMDWQFPDDAEEHFEEIKKRTACYRVQPVHEYAGYEGPWMENQFINKYINKPLGYFRGFIPLFIQWIDNQILRGQHFNYIYSELGELLRPNVLYLAISQGDVGLGKIGTKYPNIFALSAGGFGHVILPLIKGYIPPIPPPQHFPHTIGFYGNLIQSNRRDMFNIVREELKNSQKKDVTFKVGQGDSWKEDMANTKFNLAPRGYGRSSFRYAESIQIGRIPVFLHSDIPWAPYANSEYDPTTYGYVAGLTSNFNNLPELVHNLTHITDEEYNKKLAKLREVQYAFTYEGMWYEIELFLHDPFGPHGGHLTCTKHPRTERCCD